jgi:UDP-N-acetylmuramoyl-L-alanyl-D-glutamate--2,6-diaminopimelate ligase
MDLLSLTHDLGIRSLGEPAGVRICDVTDDSRTVVPGSLFIARAGAKHDGRAHIADAVHAGAVAVLTDRAPDHPPPRCAVLLTEDVALAAARIGERFFGEPSRRLTLVGVTGTNGKTTTAHLIYDLLNWAGVRSGLIGTVIIDDGVEIAPATLTTPASLEISRTLSMMVESGCRAAVMEVSSHALIQKRVAALHFDVGVYTNLTGDHLDYHATMERYADAKATLFAMLDESGVSVINAEDPWADRVVASTRAKRVNCRIDAPADARANIRARSIQRTDLVLDGPWGSVAASTSLIGRHNVMNLLQALVAATSAGIDARALGPGRLASLIARLRAPPGRLEPVKSSDLAVFVDYAHTDDALSNVLTTLVPLAHERPESKLWVVFGCGGDRDRTKRPRMGDVASRLADRVVITSDNPRTEDPRRIINEIYEGVDPDLRPCVRVEPERERAIHHAIESADPGDTIIIAGKGHEDYQIMPDGTGGTVTRHFDDREVAAQAISARAGTIGRLATS